MTIPEDEYYAKNLNKRIERGVKVKDAFKELQNLNKIIESASPRTSSRAP